MASFNPRARVGRDHLCRGVEHGDGVFQSTRPRGARRDEAGLLEVSPVVSIHAPAWGATSPARANATAHRRFNPRARVGRDASGHVATSSSTCFNPRARVGRDRCTSPGACVTIRFQSTRPRGARPRHPTTRCAWTCFNPRARVGRDVIAPAIMPIASSFNPRARVGRDRHVPGRTPAPRCFNPRARVGRDMRPVPGTGDVGRFQSTRPRGARRGMRGRGQDAEWRFNPRARVGRDVITVCLPSCGSRFNPRARVGRDDWRGNGDIDTGRFNPRARVGRDSLIITH